MAADEATTSPVRIRRLSHELRSRRRRLDAYASSPPWPGKEPARRWEQLRYDELLVLAARMLEVPAPAGCPLAPERRAALEDALAVAGLDVLHPPPSSGDPFEDGDLVL